MRAERIGYRSEVSQSFELVEGQDFEIDVPVTPVLVRLDPLTVEGARECRVIGDQALEVLTVWDEMRKALSAIAWLDPYDQMIHEMDHCERWHSSQYHSFHLDQRRTGGRRKPGLRFECVEGREIADVKGVSWLDAGS